MAIERGGLGVPNEGSHTHRTGRSLGSGGSHESTPSTPEASKKLFSSDKGSVPQRTYVEGTFPAGSRPERTMVDGEWTTSSRTQVDGIWTVGSPADRTRIMGDWTVENPPPQLPRPDAFSGFFRSGNQRGRR